MTTIIAFIFMFGLLVFVHELGHLIFAKRAGMLAREFAIGFGPKIFSYIKNETLYTIRLLPIGGYVRVAGEDPEIIDLNPGLHVALEFDQDEVVKKIIINEKENYPDARPIEIESADLDHDLLITGYDIHSSEERLSFPVDPKAMFVMDGMETQIAPYDRQFASKTKSQRAMQLFAGPMMNFLLAIVIFFLIGLFNGVPTDEAKIDYIQEDSPAALAGLESMDKITAIDGDYVKNWEDFVKGIQAHPEEKITLTVLRDNQTLEIDLTPIAQSNPDGGEYGQIGVQPAMDRSIIKTISYGFETTYETTQLVLTSLMKLITGQYSLDMIAGPVGIYDATDQVVQTGFVNFLFWTAMLSINLGIVNLLPLPALDGGRLLFVGIEAIRGKPIDSHKEGIVHVIGLALLMLLMIVITWNDIQRLFM